MSAARYVIWTTLFSFCFSTAFGNTRVNPRDFPALAKKLERWMDGLVPSHPSAPKLLEAGTGPQEAREDFARQRLRAQLEALESHVGKPAGDEVAKIRSSLPSVIDDRGEMIFRLERALAFRALLQGRQDIATAHANRALSLAPRALALPAPDGGWNHPKAPVFIAWWNKQARALRPACAISVSVTPQSAELVWNGFSLGKARELNAPPGTHSLTLRRDGYEPSHTLISCQGQSIEKVTSTLQSRLPDPKSSQQTETVLWVERENERLRLFLHTPGVALDEVPVEKPLRVADILSQPGIDIPIAQDAFIDLLERHRVASVGLTGPSASPVATTELTAVKPWYERWEFWAVAGAAVTVGVLAVLSSRTGDVGTHQNWNNQDRTR